MAALPRADLPPGAHHDLVAALHALHHRAGWPSLRTLAARAGCSHTTVSAVFSTPKLPSWGVLELVVEAMDGDTAAFHRSWLAAGAPPETGRSTLRGIAGRGSELATVRHHLDGGTGLLLVTGEAGIGKTTLVVEATRAPGVVVATGHCLPLSGQVPLLPVLDALTAIQDADAAWFEQAVAGLPAFVERTLARLLPQLGDRTPPADAGELARHHLLGSVERVLARLAALRPLALVVEDLHWADPTTLDLLEHMLGRAVPVPVVGSWREEGDATPRSSSDWLARVRRHPAARTLRLGPLTRDETAEQLGLLGAHLPERLDAIYARTWGQPLFTEQLAAHLDGDDGLPELLADLLDRRLDGLSDAGWWVLRTLGVAERPLSPADLAAASEVPLEQLTSELHVLRSRRLVRPSPDGQVELQHPLLSEAVRRRLVPGEPEGVHRSLAEVLGAGPAASAAEVADHWRRAGDRGHEVGWRVAAARHSAAAFDAADEADHWLRTLELWPAGAEEVGDPPVTRATAYVAALDALRLSLQWDRAAAMSDAAADRLGPVDDATRAELLLRAADYRGDREGAAVGLALADEALELFTRLPAGAGYLRALNHKRWYLTALGRYDESFALARRSVEVAETVGDPRLLRDQLISLAWNDGVRGDVPSASALLARGRALVPEGADPVGDLRSAMNATHVLLVCGGSLDDVEEAARGALDLARAWGIANETVMSLTANVATARLQAGLVSEAAARIGDPDSGAGDLDHWELELVRAAVDVRRGRLRAAADRVDRVLPQVLVDDEADLDVLGVAADVDFWCETVDLRLPRLLRDVDRVVDLAPVRVVLPALVAAARGAAEEAADRRAPSGAAIASVHDLVARAGRHLRPSDEQDPHVRAHLGTVRAELARAVREDRVAPWARAAALWDGLGRPHDAAYCRWRGAQAALREQQDAVAARLLRRAAVDAREHRPLAGAIAAVQARPRRAARTT